MANSKNSSATTPDPGKRAIDLLREDAFPHWWTFVPVAGKATYVPEWTTRPLTREACIEAYKTNRAYAGLGVVTGKFSGGLIAVDIDGPTADERYRAYVGDEYEALGEETTMSWGSGKPGRRQILYRVPDYMLDELEHIKKLILRVEDGEWYEGQSDTERAPGDDAPLTGDKEYEEVVLRFNHCQSVVPGSPHPETGRLYRWFNYNSKEVALAPDWVMDVLRGYRKPVRLFNDAQQKELDAELGETVIPSRQIRGWFFKDEVQARLVPRLEELIFRHETFDAYGWKNRGGKKPQRMSGCPWHGGKSGTAFQYAVESGCWDCKACGVGGDVLTFVHAVRTKNKHAGKPQGPDLEVYVAEIAEALGYDYPECARAVHVTTKEVPVKRLSGKEFFEEAEKIDNEYDNAELGDYHLMELVRDSGLGNVYRSGPQVRAALERFKMHEEQVVEDPLWQEKQLGQREYLIPDFISKPSSIMLHARGGMGKTRLAVLLSKIVGQQLPMKVRGLTVQPTTSGNVLFIGNDMSMTDYAEYFYQQGVDSAGPDSWMKFKPHWQQSQYRVLLRWLEELKPVLVVVDSLTSVSTMIAAKEYEKEYANTLYRLARENGTVFPPTTFLWIHHNTKDGTKFRGTDTLRNAVHETWELKELTEEEQAEYGAGALILEIDKSRGMRGGDRFLIREDIEEALSIEDLTPTITRENRGLGDEKPRTVVLGILKETKSAMTVKELRYELNSRLMGRRGGDTCVSARTVQRWVKVWVTAGLVEEAFVRQTGSKRGRPEPTYRVLPPICLAKDVVKYPDFFETPCAAMDPINDSLLSLNTEDGGFVVNSEPVSEETPETASRADSDGTTETREIASASSAGGSGINDINDTEEALSLNTSLETLSSTGVSEDGGRINDTEREVKEKPPSRWADDEWNAVDWT